MQSHALDFFDGPAQRRRLGQFIRWSIGLCIGANMLLIPNALRSWAGALTFANGVQFVILYLLAHRTLRKGHVQHAIALTSASILILGVGDAILAPHSLAFMVLCPIATVALGLPYLPPRHIRILSLVCAIASAVITYFGIVVVLFPPRDDRLAQFVTINISVGLILLLMWHYKNRLTEVLVTLVAANEQLQQSRAAAEALVVERTAELAAANADLEAANATLRAYAAQARESAALEERTRVAREIHDGLGHYLMAINAQAGAAQVLVERDPERTRATLGKVQSLVQTALTDVRRSVATLRATPLDRHTLPEALAALVAEHLDPPVHLVINGDYRPLDPSIDLTLYRAVQEGLTNAAKYAQATAMTIRLTYDAQRVLLTMVDDGQGAADLKGGFGLLGMQERVQLLGGTLSIKTAPGAGMTIEIEVPI